jgi:hydroxyacylglutathione hydrolase
MHQVTDGGSTMIDFVTAAPVAGSLDVAWTHGAASRRRCTDPPVQVHHFDEHTVILRQSKAVNYEAPFMFLLFGNQRALLLDTGATADPGLFPLRATVDELVARWLAANPRDQYELIVAHTHGHGDHVAGDPQFADRAGTVVVERAAEAVQQFFGFSQWPEQVVTLDLGGRVLEITGSPGHHPAAITVYDPWTGFLLTGDTVLPGRLYAFNFGEFLASVTRMVEFAEQRDVSHVLGCHVEMTTEAGRDYPLGAVYQPAERPLQMTMAQLAAVRDAAIAVADQRGAHVFDDFVIYNEPRRRDMVRLMARGIAHKIRPAVFHDPVNSGGL